MYASVILQAAMGLLSTSSMWPSYLAWNKLVALLANAWPATVITTRPGKMKLR